MWVGSCKLRDFYNRVLKGIFRPGVEEKKKEAKIKKKKKNKKKKLGSLWFNKGVWCCQIRNNIASYVFRDVIPTF